MARFELKTGEWPTAPVPVWSINPYVFLEPSRWGRSLDCVIERRWVRGDCIYRDPDARTAGSRGIGECYTEYHEAVAALRAYLEAHYKERLAVLDGGGNGE